ncbi:flagella biosynthesis regulator [Raoultella terrigena]|nr:flagella biosynthesis regulator [Raoultella terrigena]
MTPQSTLSSSQILTLLNKVFVLRVARAQETLAIPSLQTEATPLSARLKKPWLILLALAALVLIWLMVA